MFLKGEKVGLMDEEILKGLGWMDCTSKFNNIKLYGVNTEKLKNATVTLSQTDCKIKPKASLNNNTPTLNLDLFVKTKIVGIEDENPVSITNLSDCFNEVLAEKLQEKVTQECSEACEFQREKNIDVLNFYQIFNTQIHKEWQNYLKSLDSKDEYASKIQVFVKTHLTQSN